MKAVATFIVILVVWAGCTPSLSAQSQPSYLTRLVGLDWKMTSDALLKKLATEPGIKRQKDNRGRFTFHGGKMLGMPAGWWGVAYHDDKLMWMDCNIAAPGDELALYQALCKKLDAMLGPTDRTTREKVGSGVQRTNFWQSNMGGASGKGEVVMLRLKENTNNLVLTIRDPAKTGDFIKY